MAAILTVSLPASLVERIEHQRPRDVSKSRYVQRLLEFALEAGQYSKPQEIRSLVQ